MPEFNFGAGNPDPQSFPHQDLADAAARIIPKLGETLVLYPDQRGYQPLRQLAAERFNRNNPIELPVDNIALTTGSMQAISLVCQTFLQPGDTIIIEDFCYSGSLNAFRKYQANIVGIPVDVDGNDDGMNMEALEAKLAELKSQGIKPKFIYTIATNQNPTGTMMSEPKRRRLLQIARENDIPVIDDDCYADLIFQDRPQVSLYAMDPETTVYIGSFSKILGPGIRLGYFAANPETLQQILYWKIDGGTTNLAAAVAAEYFQSHMWDHVSEINGIVKEKLDAVIEQLDAHQDQFPYHSYPKGGLFIWVKLPEDCDPLRLLDIANARGIRYGTGKAFHSGAGDIKYLRLAFGYPSLETIREGIPLLAECVKQARGVPVQAATS
jgi:2-aminoadipate transaminase